MNGRDGEENSHCRCNQPSLQQQEDQVEDENTVQKMEDEIHTVVERDVPRKEMLHRIERKINERPEKIDDLEGKEVSRLHLLARHAQPREVVIEEIVIVNSVICREAEKEKEEVESDSVSGA